MASQMYMWETLIPGEEEDFEEDFIASTNEKLYVAPLTIKQAQAAFVDQEDSLIIFDPNQEAGEFRRAMAYRERQSNDRIVLDLQLELDIDLDMSDMEIDIFADKIDGCD